jgi:hypothetical protein
MDSLAANPSSSVYGDTGSKPFGAGEALDLVNKLRDREMLDFKNKANFMSDLSLKQDRMRNIFNPNQPNPQQGQNQGQNLNTQGMNTVLAHDPNQMTGYEKGELGIKKQGIDLERQKIAQAGKLGQGALDIKDAQQQLNQQKSDQINAQKQADLERKINDSSQKFAGIQAELERKTKAGEDTLQLHRDLAAAVEERHKLEMQQQKMEADKKFDDTKNLHAAQIKKMEEDTARAKETETTTEQNVEGTKRTVTTKRGEKKRIGVIGPNGESGTIEENDVLPTGWKKKS